MRPDLRLCRREQLRILLGVRNIQKKRMEGV